MKKRRAQDVAIERQRAWSTGFTSELPWHASEFERVASYTATDVLRGLSQDEAEKRIVEYGPNELFGEAGPGWFKVLLGNLFNAMNAVLTIAMIMSFVVKDYPVAVSLIIVMIINTAISFIQEYRGEKTMEALKSMSSPTARVMRNHDLQQIPTRELVPGDLCHLEEGDIVPADLRLIDSVNLEIDEGALTGESLPVSKHARPVPADSAIGDRKSLAFMNTIVTKGRGRGICIGTSLCTEIGSIAASLTERKGKPRPAGTSKLAWTIQGIFGWRDKTELQVSMDQLMYILLLCAIVLGIVVFAVDGMRFSPALLLYAVSVGVALIPEGLPAVITITMSSAVARMAKQKAIVRKLNALEALGSVTDICSDKTGTLTEGKMTATRYWIGATNNDYKVSGRGISPEGEIEEMMSGTAVSPEAVSNDAAQKLLALNCKLNTTCELFFDDEKGAWKSIGDPTEVALEVLARKMLPEQGESIKKTFEFAAEHPFDPTIKRMSVVYIDKTERKVHVFLKGALERVLETCTTLTQADGTVVNLDETLPALAEDVMESMASDAMRVLAFAQRTIAFPTDADLSSQDASSLLALHFPALTERTTAEVDMAFLGLVGIYDPPRPETRPSVQICREAGITVRMATGDHVRTAEAVAREVDIVLPYKRQLVMPATEFDAMEPEQVDNLKELPIVLARCAPKTKVKLVEAIHRRGGFVAMTGDGSNDAPAIQKADIGIAMGLGGSEVTKQVASIILTDDNFKTIVNAIAEGRRIYTNICKFVVHLLAGNVAEVLALIVGLVFRDSLGYSIFPMSPIQILWLNLFTSSPIALALGQEKADPSIMLHPPRSAKDRILSNKEILFDTFLYGLVMGAMSLGTFVGVLYAFGGPSTVGDCNHGFTDDTCIAAFRARGAAFALLTFNFLVLGLECRDSRRSIFRMKLMGNRTLVFISLATVIGTILTIYLPFINTNVFMQYPLSWEWAIIAPAQLVLLAVIELYKLWKRKADWWNPDEASKLAAERDEVSSRYSREGFVSFEIRRDGHDERSGTEANSASVRLSEDATAAAKRGPVAAALTRVPEMVELPLQRERTITFAE